MTYKIEYEVCAVLIIAILLISFYAKKKISVFQNIIFRLLLWVSFFAVICDIFAVLWQRNMLNGVDNIYPMWVYIVNEYFYFIAHNLTAFLYLFYIFSVLNLNMTKRRYWIPLYLPILVDLTLILLTPLNGYAFYFSRDGMYNRGRFLFVLYGIAAYYLLAGVFLIIRYWRHIPAFKRFALSSFAIFAMAAVTAQGLYPGVLVENFCISLCLLFIYLTIQKPEELLDHLTGLLNKTAFQTISALNISKKLESVTILVGIDNYPLMKITLGIDASYRILTMAADFLKSFSKAAVIYQTSEDKFCLVLKHYSLEMAGMLIGKITDRFNHPWVFKNQEIRLSAYCCLIRCPYHADTAEGILNLIDVVSKEENHKRKCVVKVEDLDLYNENRSKKIDMLLRTAVEDGLLSIVYQPIYSTKEERFISAEALLRLNDPELGSISPEEFIPIAENNGAIIEIGYFVLDSVCGFISNSNLPVLGIDYIEVNLSIVECVQNNLVDNIQSILERHNVRPGQINLEITETAANLFPEVVAGNLGRLAQMGVSFSMDDYGTGYSNIIRLLELPVKIVKLDKYFVQNAYFSRQADIILNHTIRMIQELQLKILIEGVETKEQAEKLIREGCDYIQGYYYSRPLDGAEFLRLLQSD